MAGRKQRRLESTVAALQQRYGPNAVRRAAELPKMNTPPSIATGFSALDAITGCHGIPVSALTLLSGPATSGKVTLAYKILANAQRPSADAPVQTVVLFDFSHSCNPDYLARCGVDLDQLLIVRPAPAPQAVDLLLDLARNHSFAAILVDSLAELLNNHAAYRRFNASLSQLTQTLRTAACTLLLVDEVYPLWLRWFNLDRSWQVRQRAAIHIEMQRERWLLQTGELVGYQARACVRKSRWAHGQPTATVAIHFNGAVTAQTTW